MIVINQSLLLSKNKKIAKKIEPLSITTQKHYRKINLNTIYILTHDIVLKIL